MRRQTTSAEAAAGPHRRAHVAQGRHRVGEEHHAHPREDVVVGPVEVGDLDVTDAEVDVVDAGRRGLLARHLEERLGDVDADHLTVADQFGEPPRRVAEAAADVEGAIAGDRRVLGQRDLAVGAEPGGHRVAEAEEALEERAAPGLGGLGVCGGDLGGDVAHRLIPRRSVGYPEQTLRIQPIRPSTSPM